MFYFYILIFNILILFISCNHSSGNIGTINVDNPKNVTGELNGTIINPKGKSVKTRFLPPKGYKRVPAEKDSFTEFLRNLPIKPWNSPVLYYDGMEKDNNGVYISVVDLPIGNRDLHQCADAVIHLRALYLWKTRQYDKIKFNFTNGFQAGYKNWMQGKRIAVNGDEVYWTDMSEPDNSLQTFYKYLNMIYAYAGSYSLSKELKPKPLEEIAPGDVFIEGGFPGHAIIVLDVAVNPSSGEKIFLLAQSYMPAQELQILQNPNDTTLNPWYSINFGEVLYTPEYSFLPEHLKTWPAD